jgi:hypothetical protein
MSQKQFFAIVGFAFVAAWIAFNFGYALLCLVGAAAFYAAGSFAQGDLDLAEVQERLRGPSGSSRGGYVPPRARRVR